MPERHEPDAVLLLAVAAILLLAAHAWQRAMRPGRPRARGDLPGPARPERAID